MQNFLLLGIYQRLGQLLQAQRGQEAPYDPNHAVRQLRQAQKDYAAYQARLKRLEERQRRAREEP